MTKKLFTIALTSLFSTTAFAADLYVRNGGAGGAYSTVSAAITAASDGDRIIIQPKTNGTAYVENLTINKSLTFVSETSYNRYFIQGTVTINPAPGRIVNISSLSSGNFTIYNVVASGPTTGGRTTINLYNCYLNNVTTNQANTTTNVSGCTVSGGISFSHGRITANKAQGISVNSTTTDTVPATTDVEVYGNKSDFGLTHSQSNYNFKFYNNFCRGVFVYAIKTGSSNEIINNTIYDPNGGDVAPFFINLNNGNTGNIAIMNNAASFVVGQTDVCIRNNNNATVTASYNVFTNAFVTEGAITQSNNSGAVNMNFNNTDYTISGMNVNAGNPDVSYTDLDLTRNDAGHYGGSNSFANYWPADSGGKPQVSYLLTPRTVTSGTLNITGTGFSK
ncbi:hypothetical protein EG346_14830 [Chryseobacterium carnipullorum]|uniref:Right handed beta helix domain-containing protein n=1 Tax=Chryseobacterium carnipullorum TaxID=1124835 RepID=A0A1M7MTF5_CHRCU|nr:hypothetical protein [Chryseobacterium carnipullorum]AZA49372.1 hypothetical protein EG346_14830 [Chryseobacterium carnipullorum]AZA64260.1 hypothetical protein EG345_05765 [Chryseobacterium carnipullorum]SHM93808.1 hypothetical protein SAMN05444360_12240 [Chryseobacterium carnipullorum]STC94229.1 Uncharacterised protein [Chryseobacterium carnipullorum]